MAGLSLHLSEKIFEEDQVKFSDGTSGKITKMGWFETMVSLHGLTCFSVLTLTLTYLLQIVCYSIYRFKTATMSS